MKRKLAKIWVDNALATVFKDFFANGTFSKTFTAKYIPNRIWHYFVKFQKSKAKFVLVCQFNWHWVVTLNKIGRFCFRISLPSHNIWTLIELPTILITLMVQDCMYHEMKVALTVTSDKALLVCNKFISYCFTVHNY